MEITEGKQQVSNKAFKPLSLFFNQKQILSVIID